MWSASRLLTPKEQVVLVFFAVAVVSGAAVLAWTARSRAEQPAAAQAIAVPAPVTPAKPAAAATPAPAPAPVSPAPTVSPERAAASTTPLAPAAAYPPPPQMAVAVRGGVRREGLYRLDADSRVADLVMQAGGATPEADLSTLNLAARLMDGTTLTVPVRTRLENTGHRALAAHGPAHDGAANPPGYLANGASAETYNAPAAGLAAAAAESSADARPTSAPAAGLAAAAAESSADARPTSAPAPVSPVKSGGLVNLNTATQAELDALPGIGPVLAERIMAYRQTQPFQNVDELNNVSGIGPKKLAGVRDLVTAP